MNNKGNNQIQIVNAIIQLDKILLFQTMKILSLYDNLLLNRISPTKTRFTEIVEFT